MCASSDSLKKISKAIQVIVNMHENASFYGRFSFDEKLITETFQWFVKGLQKIETIYGSALWIIAFYE